MTQALSPCVSKMVILFVSASNNISVISKNKQLLQQRNAY